MPPQLTARIGADYGPFTRAMRTIRGQVNQLAGDIRSIGTKLAIGFAAVSTPLVLAARHGAEFQFEMARLDAIVTPTSADLARLGRVARRTAVDMGRGASEVAQGMVYLGQAGFNTKEVIGALPGVLDLATIGSMSLADAANTVASAVRAFGLQASQASEVASQFAYVQSKSNTNVREMADAMRFIAPLAKTMNIEMSQVSAAIGLMADRNVKASMAGTTLRGALLRLINPSEQTLKVMRMLGINIRNADGSTKDLVGMLGELQKAHLTAAEAGLIFGRRAVSGMMGLLNAQKEVNGVTLRGADLLAHYNKQIQAHTDYAAEAASKIRDTLSVAWGKVKTAIGEAALSLAEKFQGPLQRFLEGPMRDLILRTADWIAKNKHLEAGFDNFFQSLTEIAGEVRGIGSALDNLFTVVTEDIADVDVSATKIFRGIRKWLDDVGPRLPKMWKDATEAVGEFADTVKRGWGELEKVRKSLSENRDTMDAIWETSETALDIVMWPIKMLGKAVSSISTGLGEAWSVLFEGGEPLTWIGQNLKHMRETFKSVWKDINRAKEWGEGWVKAFNDVQNAIVGGLIKALLRVQKLIEDIKSMGREFGQNAREAFGMLGGGVKTGIGIAGQQLGGLAGAGLKQGKDYAATLANGLAEGKDLIVDKLKGIAGLLIGHSPPPYGPLKLLDIGGIKAAEAWGRGFLDALDRATPEARIAADRIRKVLYGDFGSEEERAVHQRVAENLELTREQWQSLFEDMALHTTNFQVAFQASMMEMTLGFQTEASLWAETMQGFFGTFEQGLNQTVQSVIFGGQSISKVWRDVAKQMLKSIIATFIKIQMQNLISSLFGMQVAQTAGRATIAIESEKAWAGGAAFGARIGGPAMAAAMAAKSKAIALAGMGGLAGVSLGGLMGGAPQMAAAGGGGGPLPGLGGGPTPMAEGGIVTRPTVLLAGEAGPEAIVPLDKAGGAGGGLTGNITINLHVHGGVVDDETAMRIAEAVNRVVKERDVELTASTALLAYDVEPGGA